MVAFWLTVALGGLLCVDAPAGSYLFLQHAPTLIVMPLLWLAIQRRQIDRVSLAGVLVFVALHCIGARWIYSHVPYDDWLRSLTSWDSEDLFGWKRNHYDRFVHLMYGVCFTPVLWRIHRAGGRSIVTSGWLSIEAILATSAAYEIAEWLVAITFAPDWAESYLGQQGDLWDPIKDMALAGCGSLMTVLALYSLELRRQAVPKTAGCP